MTSSQLTIIQVLRVEEVRNMETRVTNTRGLKTGFGSQPSACTDISSPASFWSARPTSRTTRRTYTRASRKCRLVSTCNHKGGDRKRRQLRVR
jgi:hypothetical protein